MEKIEADGRIPLEAQLSIFSHVGRAAAMGLLKIGALKPTDTVVVSGAAGATGSLAAQIAKAYGCRVIGIAGGQAKCRFLKDELKLDAVIDYKTEETGPALSRLCPDGVDLYFDNVGGALLDEVLFRMAIGCRIVICGAMSQYDLASPNDAYGYKNLPQLIYRQARIEGFVVPQYTDRMDELDEIDTLLKKLYTEGKILNRAHIVEGLQQAPEALKLIFSGRNNGKLIVRI